MYASASYEWGDPSSAWDYETGVTMGGGPIASDLELPETFAYLGDLDGNGLGDAAFGDPSGSGWVAIRMLVTDGDGDGFFSDFGGLINDCDDTSSSVHPGAEERDGDGVDQDCDGEDNLVSTHTSECPAFTTPAEARAYFDDPELGRMDTDALADEVINAALALDCTSSPYSASSWVDCAAGGGAVGNGLNIGGNMAWDLTLETQSASGVLGVRSDSGGTSAWNSSYAWERGELRWSDGTVTAYSHEITWDQVWDYWEALESLASETDTTEWTVDDCSLKVSTTMDLFEPSWTWRAKTQDQSLLVTTGFECDVHPAAGEYLAVLDGAGFSVLPGAWETVPDIDADGDGWVSEYDCDDTDADRYPCGPEVTGDGDDDNCDGDDQEPDRDRDGIDDWEDCAPDDPAFPAHAWTDADGDGFGGASAGYLCEPDPELVWVSGDCDDANPEVYPDAPETCDLLDNDCDRAIDDTPEDAVWLYEDADGDGYGSDADPGQLLCDGAEGYVANADDCNDTNPGVNPAAAEVQGDRIDQDCDGLDGLEEPGTDTAHGAPAKAGCATSGDAGGGLVITLSGAMAALNRRRNRCRCSRR